MKHIISTIVTSVALVGFSMPVTAGENTFTAVFTYNADAPIEETLLSFEKVARKTCRRQTNISSMQPSYLGARYRAACRVELVNAAIEETKNEVLISQYQLRDEYKAKQLKFASGIKVELKRV